jgi:hypothetical protein
MKTRKKTINMALFLINELNNQKNKNVSEKNLDKIVGGCNEAGSSLVCLVKFSY